LSAGSVFGDISPLFKASLTLTVTLAVFAAPNCKLAAILPYAVSVTGAEDAEMLEMRSPADPPNVHVNGTGVGDTAGVLFPPHAAIRSNAKAALGIRNLLLYDAL
jgi:hypothetical protein